MSRGRWKMTKQERERQEVYCGALLKFQAWCEDRGLLFRPTMARAMSDFMRRRSRRLVFSKSLRKPKEVTAS